MVGQVQGHRLSDRALQGSLQVKTRARHIISEAQRVDDFCRECARQTSDPHVDEDQLLASLGGLMLGSHESCRHDYSCSCDELDELVGCFLRAGANGARMTGAGWGGCAVALVDRSMQDKVNFEI